MTDERGPVDDPYGIERLREAMREARQNGVTAKRMIDLAMAKDHIKPRAVNLFIVGTSEKMSEPAKTLFDEFWIRSPQGRFMRANKVTRSSPALRLSAILQSGRTKVKDGFDVSGRYYVYYGSYLKRGHLVIRAVEIEFDNDVIVATDHVIDRINDPVGGEHLISRGVMVFEGERPQILLWSDIDENKRGLSLIIAEDPRYREDRLKSFHGSLTVLTKENKVEARRCLFVREERESLDEMIAETKIFPREKIDEEKEKHRKAFVALANTHRFNLDPILWLCDWWPYKDEKFKEFA
jgi:hypothetical protein